VIQVENIRKSFGAVSAVRDVSFTATDGRITALLGPNGAGKSTTLRILATVLRPDAGRALIDGSNVSSNPVDVRRRIGVLPHAAGLYGRLTARENVAYFGALHGMRGTALRHRIDQLVERLDMGDFADRRVAGFSQGQRIKVALARALVHDPLNVMLDEPTNGLDVMATRALRDIIIGLRTEGRCVLLSSHVMQEVGNLCDDIVIVGAGTALFAGSRAALHTHAGTSDLEDAFMRVIGAAAA